MTRHVELGVEEPSMGAFRHTWLPRWLGGDRKWAIRTLPGKPALLQNLEARLRGYAAWLPADGRIVMVVDPEDDHCQQLQQHMEVAGQGGLRTRSPAPAAWQVARRIVVEELEAWYFGDWEAVRRAYPRVPRNIPRKA